MPATNTVQIRGDEMGLHLALISTGATNLEFISGSFHGSSEEERIAVAFIETTDGAPKTLEVKLTIFDSRFPKMTLLGKPVLPKSRSAEDLL